MLSNCLNFVNMSGFDDVVDESVWVNVQDPVRQMITAITKAVRSQSVSIRDMDRKLNNFTTKDVMERTVEDVLRETCSKSEANQMLHDMEKQTHGISIYTYICIYVYIFCFFKMYTSLNIFRCLSKPYIYLSFNSKLFICNIDV